MAALAHPDADVATLEADSTPGQRNDSALGTVDDDESTRSSSITSSITGYKYENGRRYHAYREGAYYLPNDEAEQSRLDLVHHIFRLALDGALYAAPLSEYSKMERCLDFGTGTGIWAIDFADEFPNAEVIGTDLSPIQPTWVPPNLKFYVDDVEDDWGHRVDEAFDFIHQRGMGGAVNDWTRLFQQIHHNLKPGGWVEMQEYDSWIYSNADPTLSHCPSLKEVVELVNEASLQFGKPIATARKYKQHMIDVGLVDVRERVIHVPIGTWAKGKKAKEMGLCQREQLCDSIDAFTIGLFTRVLGWKPEECEVIIAKAKAEVRDPKNQLYTNFFFVYGKKPEVA